MNNVIKVSAEKRFADGQSSRDLRVYCIAAELEIQLMDAIDSASDFFRFLQVSTHEIANNQRRLFKDGNQHSRGSGH